MALLNKYTYINNILSKDELNILWQYGKLFHEVNFTKFEDQQTKLGETYRYGHPITDGVLLLKKDMIANHVNKKFLPSYSFWRMYNKFSTLNKHTDRKACEYTVSITIAQDKKWPLFIDGEEIDIKPGDGVIYQGAKFDHWREEYEGDYNMQLFLHYVDAEGEFKDYIYDKRPRLGVTN